MNFYILIYFLIGSILYLMYRLFTKKFNLEVKEKYVMILIVCFYPIFFLIALIRKKIHLVSIFFSSLLQIFFVSVNTILISKELIIQAGICGFLLSLVWTFNIRRIGLASWGERISYCLGAGLGTSGGILFIKTIRDFI
jgi:hypothetical protein